MKRRWVVVMKSEIHPQPIRQGAIRIPVAGPPTLSTSFWQGAQPGQFIFVGRVWGALKDAMTFPTKRAAVGAFQRWTHERIEGCYSVEAVSK